MRASPQQGDNFAPESNVIQLKTLNCRAAESYEQTWEKGDVSIG